MTAKILVVDDEVLIRKSLQADLKQAGYEAETVDSGEAALAELDQNNYDLIVTDLMMDGISGLELIKKVKEKDPTLPVIIITGYGELKSAIEALRLGAADYLLKPYNVEELMLRINNCLKNRELQQKLKFYEKILPVCCVCKSVRDDTGKEPGSGEWLSFEDYLSKRSEVQLSHTFCDTCMQKQREEIEKMKKARQEKKADKI
ncbi:MAG: response regulator [Thermodesulfobacteriota bacterium]|nr:response regulator [Thermodesulfobacteriota bacterium]